MPFFLVIVIVIVNYPTLVDIVQLSEMLYCELPERPMNGLLIYIALLIALGTRWTMPTTRCKKKLQRVNLQRVVDITTTRCKKITTRCNLVYTTRSILFYNAL